MEVMSAAAYRHYRSLVHDTPGFLTFWKNATPVDLISELHIGSRPVARKPGEMDLTRIRAIPWVFSWMQSRFNLPGWYGLGAALNSAELTLAQIRDMYRGWPFFRVLLDNTEMSLSKADMDIARLYVELVPDQDMALGIFNQIQDEFLLTRDLILEISEHRSLMQADPVIQRSIKLRNPYIDPLNFLQLESLRRLRVLDDPDSAEAARLKDIILVTINGIAAGLRNTG
jgi:phosphoenolpyruvate carboxylase